MEFDKERYLVTKAPRDYELIILITCEKCGIRGGNPDCLGHVSEKDVLSIKVKELSWQRKNQIRTTAVKWDTNGNTMFDGDYYIRECLKAMIVEAPWGLTTDVFLAQVNNDLGSALESLVPKEGTGSALKVDQVKKE